MGDVAVLAGAAKLGGSIADLLAADNDAQEIDVRLDDIEIHEQVREEFEDEDNSLAELGDSLAKQQLQPIGLIRTPNGDKPFRLVFGERRVRAAQLKKLPTLKGKIFDMTPDEVEAAQMAENIHRKNLTQLEEAKRLKRDLDEAGGKVDVVLAKHNKSKSWLSKRLALLDLPPQALRLVTENITADKEVIGQIRTLETRDAGKAKEAVDALKARGPRGDARVIAKNAKEQVKPSTRTKTPAGQGGAAKGAGAAAGSMAAPPDLAHQTPGSVSVFPAAPVKPFQRVLRSAFYAVANLSAKPADVVKSMPDEDRDLAMAHLQSFFVKGSKAVDLAQGLIAGLRSGSFGAQEEACLALAVFVQGFEKKPALDLEAALTSINGK